MKQIHAGEILMERRPETQTIRLYVVMPISYVGLEERNQLSIHMAEEITYADLERGLFGDEKKQ
jgi:hypothetical protein